LRRGIKVRWRLEKGIRREKGRGSSETAKKESTWAGREGAGLDKKGGKGSQYSSFLEPPSRKKQFGKRGLGN